MACARALWQAVVDSGALDALVGCLEEFDPGVKEAAAWALGYIARHNGELAQTVVDAGAVPLLVQPKGCEQPARVAGGGGGLERREQRVRACGVVRHRRRSLGELFGACWWRGVGL